jgi:Protein of unknown function (DUF3277)
MSAQSATYSFKDTSGSMTNPVLLDAPIVFSGEIGMGEFVISMHTVKTTHDVAADGTVMPSAIAGDNGAVSIQMQQTSILHAQLLALYNLLKIAFDGGDVSNWAASTLSLRNTVDQSQHLLTGVSFEKIPDKTYASQGGKLTWVLMACNIQNVSV